MKSLTEDQHEAAQHLHSLSHDFYSHYEGGEEERHNLEELLDQLFLIKSLNFSPSFLISKAINLTKSFLYGDDGFTIWSASNVRECDWMGDPDDDDAFEAFYDKKRDEMECDFRHNKDELCDTIDEWIELNSE